MPDGGVTGKPWAAAKPWSARLAAGVGSVSLSISKNRSRFGGRVRRQITVARADGTQYPKLPEALAVAPTLHPPNGLAGCAEPVPSQPCSHGVGG